MKFKFLPIAAIFGCSIFGSALAQTQICPVGGGACFTQRAPASSYSSARAVDMTVRQPVPVLPTAEELARQLVPLLPQTGGNVTTDVRTIDSTNFIPSITTTFFCVAGRGEMLSESACPAGSGAIVIGRVTQDTGGGPQE